MTSAGRALELALVRAARSYRQEGRKVLLVRQHAPLVSRRDGLVYSDVGAPVDLLGAVDGVPWALEAKMVSGDSLPLKRERESQRTVLALMHACDFRVGLVVEFMTHGETYLCPWEAIAAFELAPWRRSLSLPWCRAYGLLLPDVERENERTRVTRFLDGVLHPTRLESQAEVDEERRRCPVLSLDTPRGPTARERAIAERMEKAPKPGDGEAYKEHLRKVAGESVRRKRGKNGLWRGGR